MLILTWAGIFSFLLIQHWVIQAVPVIFLNKENDLKYIRSDHVVAGIELIPTENIQFTMEGFYKNYSRYPFSVRDQVPLSSKSAGYGIFGDEELISISDGRAYGIELLGRLKEFNKTNLVFSYTFVRSEFRDLNSVWITIIVGQQAPFQPYRHKKIQ